MARFIGVEAGGTKFVCVHGTQPDDLQDRTVIPTTSPEKTIGHVIDYINRIKQAHDVSAVGIACFGPLDLDPSSETYGFITSAPTAKQLWTQYNITKTIQQATQLPTTIDTDVNGAALGEFVWGAGKGLTDILYLTVGTGIGGGVIANGKLIHGAMHPEMGHILIPQDAQRDSFAGSCGYHQNCLEGLASGPAIKDRWQVKSALDLSPEHQAWDLEAHYLGIALANYTMILSPQRIILGGGVMRQQQLIAKIRQQMIENINEYIQNPSIADLEHYIVKPALEENAGICGAIALAQQAFESAN